MNDLTTQLIQQVRLLLAANPTLEHPSVTEIMDLIYKIEKNQK
jgi:hypothetical protein